MDIRAYYKKQDDLRTRTQKKAMEAINRLDAERLLETFVTMPSITKMRLPNGDTLLHLLAKVDIEDEEQVAEVENVMSVLNEWGVDFTATDNQGRRAGGMFKRISLYDTYIRLGGL